jgi:hypothetical protein
VRAPEVVLALDVAGVEWDIHPDGKRVIVTVNDVAPATLRADGAVPAERYLVVQNWFSELKAKAGRGRQ